MSRNLLALLGLAAAGTVLGTIALRAKEPTYTVHGNAPVASIPAVLPAEVPAGSTVRTYDVEGMCCQGCSGKLYGKLVALEGVRAAAVDQPAGTAMAIVDEGVADETLVEALNFDKYTARAR